MMILRELGFLLPSSHSVCASMCNRGIRKRRKWKAEIGPRKGKKKKRKRRISWIWNWPTATSSSWIDACFWFSHTQFLSSHERRLASDEVETLQFFTYFFFRFQPRDLIRRRKFIERWDLARVYTTRLDFRYEKLFWYNKANIYAWRMFRWAPRRNQHEIHRKFTRCLGERSEVEWKVFRYNPPPLLVKIFSLHSLLLEFLRELEIYFR